MFKIPAHFINAVEYEYAQGGHKKQKVSVIGDGVLVKPSTILAAGNGLFADKDFKKNELITEYAGVRLSREDCEELKHKMLHTHIRVVNSQYDYIDGFKDPASASGKGGASFSNDARASEKNNSTFQSEFDHKVGRTRVFLKARRDIKKGEEVFVSYGNGYWKSFVTEQVNATKVAKPTMVKLPNRRRLYKWTDDQ